MRQLLLFAVLGALPLSALAAPNPPASAMNSTPASEAPAPAIVHLLEEATRGLEMPSETDAPFRVVFYPAKALKTSDAALSIAQFAALAGAPDDAEIETRDLASFFEAAATEEDWMEDEEKASAGRFAALRDLIRTELKDAQVILWGENEKQVAILGTCGEGIAGVLTLIVET